MEEKLIPIGSPADLGVAVQSLRRQMGLRQRDLALAAGVGARFLVDLEAGKPRLQLDRILQVLEALGAQLAILPPAFIPLQGVAVAASNAMATLMTLDSRQDENGRG